MKKTLAVAAVLAAFAGSAAADVTVYGKVDMGYLWTHSGDTDTLAMGNNGGNTSRIGFKGSEKIGDLTVGFQYETGLEPDNGNANKTFNNRESRVYVKGAFGEIGAGFFGLLDASTGSYSITGGISAAGTGWGGDILDQGWVVKTRSRMGNAVTYVSPAMAGVTAYVQAASGTTEYAAGKFSEFTDEHDAYYAVGAKYQNGALGAVLTVSTMEVGKATATNPGVEDKNYVAGVNYNFGAFTGYLGANYYDTGLEGQDQYGVVVSAKGALLGGTAYVSAGYGEVCDNAAGDETKMYFGVGYQYPLSKSTFLYGAANWKQSDKTDVLKDGAYGAEVNTSEVAFGIVHNF